MLAFICLHNQFNLLKILFLFKLRNLIVCYKSKCLHTYSVSKSDSKKSNNEITHFW